MTAQLALTSARGLKYWPEFVSATEEERLVAYAEAQSHWTRFGKLKRRLAFGYVYGVSTHTIVRAAPPIPPLLELLAARLVEKHMMETIADQVVVQEYPPGVGIGEHVDAPVFGPEVCSVSLLSRCVMRFRHIAGAIPAVEQVLESRSGLAMTGSSRTDWSHRIDGASVIGRRLSITFRTLARAPQG
jgi:alkylated DNA repair dioxygenase AlkB